MIGRFADTGALGVITSSSKQSSSPSTVTDEANGSQAGVLWMHEGPCTVALSIFGRKAQIHHLSPWRSSMNLLRGLFGRCWTSYTTAASRVAFVSMSDLLLTWSVFGSRFRNNHIEQTMELRFQIRHIFISFRLQNSIRKPTQKCVLCPPTQKPQRRQNLVAPNDIPGIPKIHRINDLN